MVEKVDVYSDKSNGSKIYAFDYLRVIALVMILYAVSYTHLTLPTKA